MEDLLYLRNDWIEGKFNEIINYKSTFDLINSKPIIQITYSDLLNCFEWQFKRFKILVRDKFSCIDCGEIDNRLHVHHKYYIKGSMPWEIDDSALVSLCRKCHFNRHETEIINVYEKVGNSLSLSISLSTICPRCFGSGHLPQYNHVENGICFLCMGDVINKTVFSSRLNEISNNKSLYNLDEVNNNFLEFMESVPLDFYINHIHDKLYGELSSMLAPHNAIIYVKGESELLDFLMAAEEENERGKENYNEYDGEEDDLPF